MCNHWIKHNQNIQNLVFPTSRQFCENFKKMLSDPPRRPGDGPYIKLLTKSTCNCVLVQYLHSPSYESKYKYNSGAQYMRVLICLAMPNSQEFFSSRKNRLQLQWTPSKKMAVFFSLLMCIAVSKMSEVSEFLYFQF